MTKNERMNLAVRYAMIRGGYFYVTTLLGDPAHHEDYESFNRKEIDSKIASLVEWKRTEDMWADLDRWARIVGELYLAAAERFTPEGGEVAAYLIETGETLSKGLKLPIECLQAIGAPQFQ